jgi:hypothetical protein
MKRTPWKFIWLVVLSTAALTVAATSASAHRGPGFGAGSANALVTEAAKQLDVTVAKLKDAIVDAAIARIDEAVKENDVDEDDAAELKEAVRNNLRYAMAIGRTRAVAANAGVTVARLNTAFRAARKALIIARINEAVDDGDLTAAQAAELKEDLEDVELPGYKAFGGRGFGFGFGHGPFRR